MDSGFGRGFTIVSSLRIAQKGFRVAKSVNTKSSNQNPLALLKMDSYFKDFYTIIL